MVTLLEAARRASARTVNAIMTATYWEMGRRIVECEQGGKRRAEYGEALIRRLSEDLSSRFGRGFSPVHLALTRQFFLSYPRLPIFQSLTEKSGILQSATEESIGLSRGQSSQASRADDPVERDGTALPRRLRKTADAFPLSWTHYVRLLRVRSPLARDFYHGESLRGSWTVRQLDRQINSQFYERTALSRRKDVMLIKGQRRLPEDAVTPEEEVRDPLVLEFLGLKDEYSESELEDALIAHLEAFLLELGGSFTFVGRQRPLRIDHRWYRVDLLMFHRRLRSLVVIDLKIGPLTHEDVGQMHVYLNYAREHWVEAEENPPIGIILCSEKGEALARYALDGLPNKMLVREYRTALPTENTLAVEIARTRELLEARRTSLQRKE